MAVTAAITLLMVPLACWHGGLLGVGVSAASGVVVLLAIGLSRSVVLWVGREGLASIEGLLLAMLVRTGLPLAFSLAVVILGRGFVPPQSVLYLLPIYLSMLLVETVVSLPSCPPGVNRGQ